ncbi:MAG: hypothetical protein LKKZDAJK_001553 [Candidatus Fervidibacter sp.]
MGERDGGISEGGETVMKGCYQGRLGLTLIELLLVIGIIAVLAGIIWCAFAPVREKARVVHCMNNLKQVHLALEIYRQDYGGVEAEVGRRAEYWELGLPLNPRALKPYSKTSTTIYCPLTYLLGERSKDLWMMGYMWAVWRGKALGVSGPNWSYVIAQRGEEFPISADSNHNPRGYKEFPQKFVIVLRLNGKVEAKQIWVPGSESHEW